FLPLHFQDSPPGGDDGFLSFLFYMFPPPQKKTQLHLPHHIISVSKVTAPPSLCFHTERSASCALLLTGSSAPLTRGLKCPPLGVSLLHARGVRLPAGCLHARHLDLFPG
ncbi:hypothetical protein KUCAC02_035037, partial [Chaenocephalus aceratus]